MSRKKPLTVPVAPCSKAETITQLIHCIDALDDLKDLLVGSFDIVCNVINEHYQRAKYNDEPPSDSVVSAEVILVRLFDCMIEETGVVRDSLKKINCADIPISH